MKDINFYDLFYAAFNVFDGKVLCSLSNTEEMANCSPPPSKSLSKHAPLIHVMKVCLFHAIDLNCVLGLVICLTTCSLPQVKPDKINLIIGSGGKKVKSIIEETGVEAIETQDDGVVRSGLNLILNGYK